MKLLMVRKITDLLILFLVTSCFIQSCAAIDEVNVIVGFDVEQDMSMLLENDSQVKYQYDIINAVAMTLSQDELTALRNNSNVLYIEEDVPVYLADERLEWNVNRTGADRVWNIGNVPDVMYGSNAGDGVKVAIIDTGIDKDHPDLQDNIAGGVSYTTTYPNDTNMWNDGNGHGTHVAGIIAAVDNDIGVIGVAPHAELYAVKVIRDGGSGTLSDLIAGIDWARAHDMDVISMSLSVGAPLTSLENACDNAYDSGIVLVAAAGNNKGPVTYPAIYDSVIAVSATTSTDSIAVYSNWGPEIELAAPGSRIYSTYKNGDYVLMSGTSMATPHITGAVALVLNTKINVTYDLNNNNEWDPAEVRQRLKDTATDLGAEGWDMHFGYGLVNAYEATLMGVQPPNDTDWNPWDDDGKISNREISLAEWHWATVTPINGHIITNQEISLLEYYWITGSVIQT